MSAVRKIKTISITELGQLCALSVLGTQAAPGIAYARRTEDASRASHGSRDMLCSVRNAFLFGPSGFVVLPDGTVIKESVLDLGATAFAQNFDQFKALFPGEQILWSHATEPVVSLNGYSTNNYFHFMIDNLPNLDWYQDAPQLGQWRAILSGFPPRAEALMPYISAARDMLGLDESRVFPFDGTLMFCSQIVFPARHMGATPRAVESLRHMFAAQRATVKPHRLLYIDRPASERRQIVNASAVRALAIKHGFEIINPGAMPLAEQIKVFSEARAVCGPHGAAFANIAFMAPGGALLELTHSALLQPAQGVAVGKLFSDLATASGLSYRCIVGEPAGAANEPLNADFSVDVAQMETALVAMSAALQS